MAKKVDFSTKYDYYTRNFESKLKKYKVGERESLREDRYISSRWFEINYNAAKEYLIEKHREREMAKPESERNLYNLRPLHLIHYEYLMYHYYLLYLLDLLL